MTVMATRSVHKLLCITVNTEIWDALDLIILRAVSSHPLAYMSTSTHVDRVNIHPTCRVGKEGE